MFIVNNYRITFEKSHSLIISNNPGRFDTVCRIEGERSGLLGKGIAYLHPKDRPDKIIGKKVALTKALIERIKIEELPNGTKIKKIIWRNPKSVRTQIWKAFWEWVESWKSGKHIFHTFTEGEELAYCNVCKAGEGELTTECCGRKMTEEERHRVYEVGDLDFINGKWTKKK